jgi:hypothetical protein
MKHKAILVIDRKENRNDGSIIQAIVWELPGPLRGSSHRFKYRLYFGKNGICLVRFDNEQGKGDHKHIKGVESPYLFKDIATLLRDFREAIRNCEVSP